MNKDIGCYLLFPPPRGPGPHVRLEDDLHLTVLILRGGFLGGRFLRGSLLPRKIRQVGEFIVLKNQKTFTPYCVNQLPEPVDWPAHPD
jgi:hypothetical protein